jgi:hypothetical protein
MILRSYLRTIDLVQAVGISAQQVGNYEAWGMLPPAERSKISPGQLHGRE